MTLLAKTRFEVTGLAISNGQRIKVAPAIVTAFLSSSNVLTLTHAEVTNDALRASQRKNNIVEENIIMDPSQLAICDFSGAIVARLERPTKRSCGHRILLGLRFVCACPHIIIKNHHTYVFK
jgi:hypothetical protein